MADNTLTEGPMRLLCKEIGFDFDQRLERDDVFMAFVGSLVDEIEQHREVKASLARHGVGVAPSRESQAAIEMARAMLAAATAPAAVLAAEQLHVFCDEANPEDKIPTDHLIDMVSSCASAVRFGRGDLLRSRHAAEAAAHVWQKVYGLSREDRYSNGWRKTWTRSKLIEALLSLLPPETHQAPSPDTCSHTSATDTIGGPRVCDDCGAMV